MGIPGEGTETECYLVQADGLPSDLNHSQHRNTQPDLCLGRFIGYPFLFEKFSDQEKAGYIHEDGEGCRGCIDVEPERTEEESLYSERSEYQLEGSNYTDPLLFIVPTWPKHRSNGNAPSDGGNGTGAVFEGRSGRHVSTEQGGISYFVVTVDSFKETLPVPEPVVNRARIITKGTAEMGTNWTQR